MQLKNIESYVPTEMDEDDVMSDIRYICKSCSLITESLQKGCDVMQMPNGDIIITMLKPMVFHYSWDAKKGKLVRSQPGNKLRKTKPRKNTLAKQAAATEAKKLAERVEETV